MSKGKFSLKEYSTLAGVILTCGKLSMGQVIYTDLEPDIILDAGNLYIDLDDNLINDFNFKKIILQNSNTSDIICYSTAIFGFTCVNTGNSIIGTEVILGNDIVSPLNYGDPINNSAQFNDDYWQYITLKDREIGCLYSNPLSPWDYANLGNWAASIDEDKYIGVKFKGEDENCVYYGWVRCVLSDSLDILTIKDFAYNSNCGTGLIAGMLITETENKIIIEPHIRLVGDEIFIEIDESQVNANCKVVNLAGQVVKSVNLSSAISIFNIADLPSGILIFKLYDANLSYTKKVFLK
jgi:hypothetical protein